MPEDNGTRAVPTTRSPWVIDTHELGRSPGSSRRVQRTVALAEALGVYEVIVLPERAEVEVEVLLESVVEGVLASGTASSAAEGQCARCLDPVAESVHVEFTELFAFPESTTEETTEEDEVSRIVDDLVDLEPVVRDALVLALPQVPLCTPDCAGLCAGCGLKWAELEPGHGHETMDPRWAALLEWFGDDRDRQQ